MEIIKTYLRKLKVKKIIQKSENIKLIVGSGGTTQVGWISTDFDTLDITIDSDWSFLLGNKKASAIVAEHVMEHLNWEDIIKSLLNVRKYVRMGGYLRIAVPDGNHPSKYVIDLVKPNGLEPGADDHKVLLNIEKLESLAKELNYFLVPIEYFDKKGHFHSKELNDQRGFIKRSSKHYKGRFTEDKKEYSKFINSVPRKLRNQFIKYNFSYTSLLVDLYIK
ncbi:MAG: hypothetical protein UT08_C0001G0033 [Candidatus Woesebacteria bacterium GW2011_GWB1_38_8]|uniref:Methyltransferase type 11 domain-containing protein n=1 Tax=Candidatus Woesebacteria bacterium GW2011_GWB1_38_8 TaxID=1618570 RepID=A0A0G0L577_9BACT|nr:MAG: hypothetical protein UT08_C0001G0033 [Candidatus Woesebacteria bacterium GW2011_GWB1_38_8]